MFGEWLVSCHICIFDDWMFVCIPTCASQTRVQALPLRSYWPLNWWLVNSAQNIFIFLKRLLSSNCEKHFWLKVLYSLKECILPTTSGQSFCHTLVLFQNLSVLGVYVTTTLHFSSITVEFTELKPLCAFLIQLAIQLYMKWQIPHEKLEFLQRLMWLRRRKTVLFKNLHHI